MPLAPHCSHAGAGSRFHQQWEFGVWLWSRKQLQPEICQKAAARKARTEPLTWSTGGQAAPSPARTKPAIISASCSSLCHGGKTFPGVLGGSLSQPNNSVHIPPPAGECIVSEQSADSLTSLINVRAQPAPSQRAGANPEQGQQSCLHLEAEPVPSPAQESRRVEPMAFPPTYSSLSPQILKELKTKRLPTGSFSIAQFLWHCWLTPGLFCSTYSPKFSLNFP